MAETADVLIIGGGVHGASLAFHLAERGAKAVVLEKRFLAAEATGRSSGLVRMHYDLEVEARLAWESFHYFNNWSERVGGHCGFTRTGFLQIVKPTYLPQLKANAAMLRRLGVPTQVIDAREAQELFPGLDAGDFELAAYEPESGYADPSGTARSLMEAAVRRGARLVQDCRVTGASRGGAWRVETTRGAFEAPQVVNAAGAWAGEVGRMAGLNLPVRAWRHDTLFVRRPPGLAEHPTVIDDPNAMYFRPETGGLTLIGLEDHNRVEDLPGAEVDYARPECIDRAVERICRRIPAMEMGSLHSSQGGYDGITPDQHPILGPAGPEGFFLCCGFSGMGFKIAPAVGACLASLMLEGRSEPVDLSPFRLERFAEGKPLRGEHAYEDAWQ